MGNWLSGEWRTVKVPSYTTNADYKHLISHRRALIKILDDSNCKLNEAQQHTLSKIKEDQGLIGGKSRKHRNYKNRTKKLRKK